MGAGILIIVAEIEPDGIILSGIGDKYGGRAVVPDTIVEDGAKAIAGVVLPRQRDTVITIVVNIILANEVISIALPLAEGDPVAGVVVNFIPLDEDDHQAFA